MTTDKRALRAALVLALAVVPFGVACSSSGSSALPERTSSPIRSQTVSPPATSRSGFTRPPTSEPPAVSTSRPAVVPTRTQEPSRQPTQAPPPATNAPPPAGVTSTAPATSTPALEPSVAATAVAATASDESTPWGWILLAAAVAAAIVMTAILLHRRSQRRRMQAWRQQTRGAVDAAFVSRDLLPTHGRDIVDLQHWESVRAAADQAAVGLRTAAGTAPTSDAAAAANTGAEALTAMTFALESARLVQAAQPPPSAAQLADADALVQSRKTELDGALERLQAVVEPPAGADTTQPEA